MIKSIIFQDIEILYNFLEKEYNRFQKDSLTLFIRHFALIFFVNGEYIMDDEYFTALDAKVFKMGEEEPWISPIIQSIFDKYIKQFRPDVAKLLTEKLNGDLK